ncbi:hypothetical protein [Emcibacter sp.]|uniref:hypothetical protein n=1 Tax=Emcibacter sp. TaxID=1979954 RepID=UPI002AA954CB|nr:hypothetical protein [Emcibacter sp.]
MSKKQINPTEFYPIDEQITCAERELTGRKRNYPAMVERGEITEGTAFREIELMEAILGTLKKAKSAW